MRQLPAWPPCRLNTGRASIETFSPAQLRILEVAFELFSAHGVSGTSLQMIAKALGVTKAAVYHQFQAKEDIVHALGSLIFDRLEELMDTAEAQPSRLRSYEALVEGLIDLAVLRRRSASFIQQDPVMLRLIQEHPPFRRVMERLDRLLTGNRMDTEARVAAAMLVTAIGGAVMHPLVSETEDDALRDQLGLVARSLFKFLK